MKKKMSTIGDWLAEFGEGTDLKPSGFWTVVRDDHGSHAVVLMRVLLVKRGVVLAQTRTTAVARGQDCPFTHETWAPGAPAVTAANQLLCDSETRGYANLPAQAFWGVNRAMPWELPEPPRQSRWARIWTRLAFWKKAEA